jgi:ferrous iron transport protein B
MSQAPPAEKREQLGSYGAAHRQAAFHVVLCGNPNCGKTTLFNVLTGLRAKVGNYPGVTVERKEGRLVGSSKERPVTILDVPGTYSLSPQSLDEQIARDVLFGRVKDVLPPDLVVVVVDASNLQRNLYFATQVIELGYPTVLALNMVDVAREHGNEIDTGLLAKELGVKVFATVANTGQGIPELRQIMLDAAARSSDTKDTDSPDGLRPRRFCELPKSFANEIEGLVTPLSEVFPRSRRRVLELEAELLLSSQKRHEAAAAHGLDKIQRFVASARKRLDEQEIDWRGMPIESRYRHIALIQEAVTRKTKDPHETMSDRLDRVFTHRLWGLLIFAALMLLMFQSIFTFAQWPMDIIQALIDRSGSVVASWLSPGPLNDLLVKGVIQGVGAVIVFLPQICLLFLFIGLLEDTGYMARAAFLMDRFMSKVGLHGKSFIPMLSSFACAIPGIMATRTIESPKDRLATILVAPLMSCSARLPVYTILIAACIPNVTVLGFLKLSGLTMMGMYLLGIVVALFMAWLFKNTLLKGPTPLLIMELPPYKRPLIRSLLRHMWERSKIFLRRAGTVILGINILLWYLASYPRTTVQPAAAPASVAVSALENSAPDGAAADAEGEQLRQSFAGRFGRAIEPLIAPLGFDWKIGIGIVSSFAAREVFVSTMSLVYNVGEFDDSEGATRNLADTLRAQKRPDGSPVYTLAVALALMVFYVFALQCVSTVAVVRRETNSWKWPVFQWLYMGVLAWGFAFVTFRLGSWLGWN